MCLPLDDRQAWDAWKGSCLRIIPAVENSGNEIVHSKTEDEVRTDWTKQHQTAEQLEHPAKFRPTCAILKAMNCNAKLQTITIFIYV